MPTYDLADRSALVTGAGSGIGRAVALELARSGAAVLVADLSGEAARRVAEEITAAGGTADAVAADVADPGVHAGLVEAAGRMAPFKVAVNNAGIGGEAKPVGEYSTESWLRVIDVNLNAVFHGLRAQIPAMVAAGGGSVVTMASVLGSVGIAGSSAYVASKHAVVGLTKAAAMEYSAQGVRVNAVGPGFIRTPLLDANLDTAAADALAAQHATGRLGTAEEVAALTAFLASDAASFITGSYHLVDGGYSAH
ncbi:SDR family NAD(P)-dependent oxidoreductase [Kineococcus endophyticus]|uniref:SDR family NAD(P)-dependent oxidoreductase n=1 Tax=Kineococcus endophyticus TaxID=1181883 RepID=A0ABV3PCJ8_9ACTN